MSLDYNFTGIKNFKEVVWLKFDDSVTDKEIRHRIMQGATVIEEDRMYQNPITEAILWATIEVGIGQITEANYIEFWMRMAMVDGMRGGRIIVTDDKGDMTKISITLEEVKQHIGLRTNVSKETTTKWYNKLLKGKQSDEAYRLRRLAEREEEKEDAA